MKKAVITILVLLCVFLLACAPAEDKNEMESNDDFKKMDDSGYKESYDSEGSYNEDSQDYNNYEEVYENSQSEIELYVNGVKLSQSEIQDLEQQYGEVIPGRYWYDTHSGLYGPQGQAASSYILPGHSFGTLAADASNGRTGVYINGRELPESELQYLENLLNVQRQLGHYWMDSQGNIGFQGISQPFGNVFLAGSQNYDDGYVWRDWYTGAGGGGQGGCNYINIPGSTGISAGFYSSGC